MRFSASVIKQIINDSRSLGILLLFCTLLSLLLTNSGEAGIRYHEFWKMEIPLLHQLLLPHTVAHFINDALMTLFFFHVAIDIKREATVGELSTPKRMALPAVSALFGVIVPALIFISINEKTPFAKGWAIPTATDIAFSLGIISLLGRAVPRSFKVFLTALAIIDDLCAILIIALFYGSSLHLLWLLGVLLLSLVIYIVNRRIHNRLGSMIMILLGIAMWYAMFQSGIHASIAGVIVAFLLPVNKIATYKTRLNFPVNFVVIPIFALANTSIVVSAAALSGLGSTLSLGIILGLLLGKPAGISLSVYLMIKLKLAEFGKIRWSQFAGVGILAGIGFTMAIFVSNLAFPGNPLQRDIAKLSVLIASGMAMIVGYIWLRVVSKGAPSQ